MIPASSTQKNTFICFTKLQKSNAGVEQDNYFSSSSLICGVQTEKQDCSLGSFSTFSKLQKFHNYQLSIFLYGFGIDGGGTAIAVSSVGDMLCATKTYLACF